VVLNPSRESSGADEQQQFKAFENVISANAEIFF